MTPKSSFTASDILTFDSVESVTEEISYEKGVEQPSVDMYHDKSGNDVLQITACGETEEVKYAPGDMDEFIEEVESGVERLATKIAPTFEFGEHDVVIKNEKERVVGECKSCNLEMAVGGMGESSAKNCRLVKMWLLGFFSESHRNI